MKKYLMILFSFFLMLSGCDNSDIAQNYLYKTYWEGEIVSEDEEYPITIYFHEMELAYVFIEGYYNGTMGYKSDNVLLDINLYRSGISSIPSKWYIEKLTKNTLQLSEWGAEDGYTISLKSKI